MHCACICLHARVEFGLPFMASGPNYTIAVSSLLLYTLQPASLPSSYTFSFSHSCGGYMPLYCFSLCTNTGTYYSVLGFSLSRTESETIIIIIIMEKNMFVLTQACLATSCIAIQYVTSQCLSMPYTLIYYCYHGDLL